MNTTTITHTAAAITVAIRALDELTEAHFELLLCVFQYVRAEMGGMDAAGFTGSLEQQMEDLYQSNLVISDPKPGRPFNMRPSPIAEELFELVTLNGCVAVEPREAFETKLRRTEQTPLFVEETLNY